MRKSNVTGMGKEICQQYVGRDGVLVISTVDDKGNEEILDGLSATSKILLQTNEVVVPTKAESGLYSYFGQTVKGSID